ncbi:MAG: rod shape-determining protein MreC [Patescibacteria group bacterium]|jgi:rod shape-determining protein MreC
MPILPKKRSVEWRRLLQTSGGIVLGLIFLFGFWQFSFFQKFVFSIGSRLTSIGTGIHAVWNGTYQSTDELTAERDYYRDLAAKNASDAAYLERLERDVVELEQFLFYAKGNTENTVIIAKVIARSPEGNFEIWVDQGSNQGVGVSMAVAVEDGHLMGTVTEVLENRSRITLLGDFESHIPATILEKDQTLGMVEGQGGYVLSMDYIPQNETLTVGDMIVTSGLDGILPYGLVIGSISEVNKDASEPFQQAQVQPYYDANEFLNVMIIENTLDRYAD